MTGETKYRAFKNHLIDNSKCVDLYKKRDDRRKEKLLQVYSYPNKPQEDDSADEREEFFSGINFGNEQKTDEKKGQSKKAKVEKPKKVTPKEKKKRDPLRDSKDSTSSNTGFFGGDINFTEPEKVWI